MTRSYTNFVFALFLALPFQAGASKSALIKRLCGADLAGDEALANLESQGRSRLEFAVGKTHLLCEGLTPVMNEIADLLISLDEDDIVRYDLPVSRSENTAPRRSRTGPLKFDRRFEGLTTLTGPSRRLTYPWTSHNRRAMHRLARSVLFSHRLLFAHLPDLEQNAALITHQEVLNQHTFGKTLLQNMLIGEDTVLQSAAQLTSDPVGHLTAEEVLIRALRAPARGTSLMARHALLLAPGLLGRFGDAHYRAQPVVEASRDNDFSPAYRDWLARQRREFKGNPEPGPFELGLGCPVAHVAEGAQTSALQRYLEALLHVFERLPN